MMLVCKINLDHDENKHFILLCFAAVSVHVKAKARCVVQRRAQS